MVNSDDRFELTQGWDFAKPGRLADKPDGEVSLRHLVRHRLFSICDWEPDAE